eukprot:CAMPEP_0179477446 /NCGR_PEP_ID=MMETSP0799-20121207/56182_1 /TAXON_ID=46947 /ORGANISM="Geminigera cryophila, Strain CCMP2564" /LENGTH=40 /DNA_ID= /DNA_START= /DNA_END= /DNA_ORIENTATION=
MVIPGSAPPSADVKTLFAPLQLSPTVISGAAADPTSSSSA